MKTLENIFYPAHERGFADHGWLKAHHSFSFANYYNKTRMNFGKIRVLNDDEIAPGMGFGEHGHENMEIITIPLEGSLKHQDSTGQTGVLKPGEVQIMSAGSGIRHSEFNASSTETLKLFQIWVQTAEQNANPRYGQKLFWKTDVPPSHLKLISPTNEESLKVLQDFSLDMFWLKEGETIELPPIKAGRGTFLMVVEGEVSLGEQNLKRRDAYGIVQLNENTLKAKQASQLMILQTPL